MKDNETEAINEMLNHQLADAAIRIAELERESSLTMSHVHALFKERDDLKRELSQCPFCDGRGGFDLPEDAATCAWCDGTGSLIREKVGAHVRNIWRTNQEISKERNEAQTQVQDLKRENAELKEKNMVLMAQYKQLYATVEQQR